MAYRKYGTYIRVLVKLKCMYRPKEHLIKAATTKTLHAIKANSTLWRNKIPFGEASN